MLFIYVNAVFYNHISINETIWVAVNENPYICTVLLMGKRCSNSILYHFECCCYSMKEWAIKLTAIFFKCYNQQQHIEVINICIVLQSVKFKMFVLHSYHCH
jgi:hypothetical protein